MIEFITEYYEWFNTIPQPKINTALIVVICINNLISGCVGRADDKRFEKAERKINDLEWEVGSIRRNTWR